MNAKAWGALPLLALFAVLVVASTIDLGWVVLARSNLVIWIPAALASLALAFLLARGQPRSPQAALGLAALAIVPGVASLARAAMTGFAYESIVALGPSLVGALRIGAAEALFAPVLGAVLSSVLALFLVAVVAIQKSFEGRALPLLALGSLAAVAALTSLRLWVRMATLLALGWDDAAPTAVLEGAYGRLESFHWIAWGLVVPVSGAALWGLARSVHKLRESLVVLGWAATVLVLVGGYRWTEYDLGQRMRGAQGYAGRIWRGVSDFEPMRFREDFYSGWGGGTEGAVVVGPEAVYCATWSREPAHAEPLSRETLVHAFRRCIRDRAEPRPNGYDEPGVLALDRRLSGADLRLVVEAAETAGVRRLVFLGVDDRALSLEDHRRFADRLPIITPLTFRLAYEEVRLSSTPRASDVAVDRMRWRVAVDDASPSMLRADPTSGADPIALREGWEEDLAGFWGFPRSPVLVLSEHSTPDDLARILGPSAGLRPHGPVLALSAPPPLPAPSRPDRAQVAPPSVQPSPDEAGCSPDGWCRQAPVQEKDLLGVWGSGPTDVFAVGADGTVLHYDGETWSLQNSGTSETLYSVWGSGPANVFAVGAGGTLLHYDGRAWSAQASGMSDYLYSVWGSGPADVFVVGSGGTVLHFDGQSWSALNTGNARWLSAVWGSGPRDVFAVGIEGTTVHYDGQEWSLWPSDDTAGCRSVWGSGPNQVFTMGPAGTMLHYDGETWSAQRSGTSEALSSVRGSGPSDVFAVGSNGAVVHFDGRAWSAQRSSTSEHLNGVWGSGPTDVFAVGMAGTVLHYGGP